MARVLLLLPDRDFDVTEVAVPWKLLKRAGHDVIFATELAATASCDPLLLSGVIFGQLGAEPEAREFYRELERDPAFVTPIRWREIRVAEYDALLLPGGHAQGMRQYLGSSLVQEIVTSFWKLDRPVAAICHGVLVAARAGVLTGRTTTCLPKYMERTAYMLTAWKLGRYYRTYDAYVEDEVIASGANFARGPRNLTSRGTEQDSSAAFVVEDGKYISARWPGDAYLFAQKLIARIAR